MSSDGEGFGVLHVCTGNIGRSPMAERIMRQHLAGQLGDAASAFDVGSAGTGGYPGAGLEPGAAAALRQRGADAGSFSARELTEELVVAADLVLTATTEHRTAVVGLVPGAVRYTFTLREFARLAPAVAPLLDPLAGPVARARQSVGLALRARGAAPKAPDPTADDVADPIGAPLAFYEDRASEIDAACARAVALFAGDGRLQ
jgi:protein-tyrosine phosphatase